MSDDPINFEAFKDRRDEAEIEADQAEWEAVRDALIAVLGPANLTDHSVAVVTLRALLDVLEAGGRLSPRQCIDEVRDTLATFEKMWLPKEKTPPP